MAPITLPVELDPHQDDTHLLLYNTTVTDGTAPSGTALLMDKADEILVNPPPPEPLVPHWVSITLLVVQVLAVLIWTVEVMRIRKQRKQLEKKVQGTTDGEIVEPHIAGAVAGTHGGAAASGGQVMGRSVETLVGRDITEGRGEKIE